MEGSKLLTMIVTVTVGIIFVGALLGPVINDASTTERTFTNEGYFNYGVFEPTDTYELTIDITTGAVTVGDDSVTIPSALYGPGCSLISSDDFLVRYGRNSGGFFVQAVGIDSNGNTVAQGFGGTIKLSIDEELLKLDYESSGTPATKTFSFESMYAIVADPDVAVLKKMADSVYIKGDSELYASGLTNVTAWTNVFHFEGNYKDGIVISSPSLPTATYDNITWNIEPVAGYIDLYKLTSIEFDIIYNDTTVHATYSYFGVPTEVTAELSQHLDSGEIALLAVLPLIAITALLLLAVRFFTGRD